MFRVLKAPFPEELKNVAEGSCLCVAYESHKGVRFIIGALRVTSNIGTSYLDWYTTVAEELNNPPSFEFVKLMLGSIWETGQRGERQRQEEARRLANPHPRFFGADFGRRDVSSLCSEPSPGAWGVDAWD